VIHGQQGSLDDERCRDPQRLNWNLGRSSAQFLANAICAAIVAGATEPLTRDEARAMHEHLTAFLAPRSSAPAPSAALAEALRTDAIPGHVGYGRKVHWLVRRQARGPAWAPIERETLAPLCESRGRRTAIGPAAYRSPGCSTLPAGTAVSCSRCLSVEAKRAARRVEKAAASDPPIMG
jgi:hypothetical protein